MTDSISTLMLLGLTGSGKTNFLVALDVALDKQSDANGLVHADLAADRSYLQPLKEKWLRGEELEHTSRLNPPSPHHLLVRQPATGATASLHLPDLAGETFDSHFITRSFPIDFRNRVKAASGILLFVHCDSNADHTILQAPALMDVASSGPTSEPAAAITEWSLEDAARQVKLVDLIQFILKVRAAAPSLRIAVLVSAWDLIENIPAALAEDCPKNPALFLAKRWPLLDQFLRAHEERIDFRAFGISARGGGTSPEDVARLTALDSPVERLSVKDGDARSNDFTRPIRWLLGMSL